MPAEPQDRSIECLNKIYQGAQMGCESISLLTEKVTDAQLLNDLHEQHDQYAKISCQPRRSFPSVRPFQRIRVRLHRQTSGQVCS